jgi:hypothetical protein
MVNNDNTLNDYQFPHQNNYTHANTTSSNIIANEANDKIANSSSFFPPLN